MMWYTKYSQYFFVQKSTIQSTTGNNTQKSRHILKAFNKQVLSFTTAKDYIISQANTFKTIKTQTRFGGVRLTDDYARSTFIILKLKWYIIQIDH